MSTTGKLYLDSEGVRRGYYVYVHRDRATGEVFYVGKGHGRRAWDKQRNSAWKEKVASLRDGWEAEIVQDDLTEIEAFELEAQLVQEHGGPATDGGQLTNLIPGGESPADVGFRIDLGNQEWARAYYEARKFKESPRNEQEDFATTVKHALEGIAHELMELEEKGFENDEEALFETASDVGCIIAEPLESADDFIRRRIAWKELGLTLEDAVGDLEFQMEDFEKGPPRVVRLARQSLAAAKRLLRKIDSGNQALAEREANKVVGRE